MVAGRIKIESALSDDGVQEFDRRAHPRHSLKLRVNDKPMGADDPNDIT